MPTYINRKNGMRQNMAVEQFNKLDDQVKGKYRLATDAESKATASEKKPTAPSKGDEKK